MSVMEQLLETIRTAIASKAISVSFLARECGVSREYVYRLLAGDSCPTMTVAEKLASAVGMEITLRKAVEQKKTA
jgi:DNA-binding phage protein